MVEVQNREIAHMRESQIRTWYVEWRLKRREKEVEDTLVTWKLDLHWHSLEFCQDDMVWFTLFSYFLVEDLPIQHSPYRRR